MKSHIKSVFSIGPVASENIVHLKIFILLDFLGTKGDENLQIYLLWPNIDYQSLN